MLSLVSYEYKYTGHFVLLLYLCSDINITLVTKGIFSGSSSCSCHTSKRDHHHHPRMPWEGVWVQGIQKKATENALTFRLSYCRLVLSDTDTKTKFFINQLFYYSKTMIILPTVPLQDNELCFIITQCYHKSTPVPAL